MTLATQYTMVAPVSWASSVTTGGGYYIQLFDPNTGLSYTSINLVVPGGPATFVNIPNGRYQAYVSAQRTGPFTAIPGSDGWYVLAADATGATDLVAHSLTVLASGPYAPLGGLAAGGIAVATVLTDASGVVWFNAATKQFTGISLDTSGSTINWQGGNQTLYGASTGTGLAINNTTGPLKLEAGSSGSQFINDVTHDYNIAMYVTNWTAGGAGIVLSQFSTGDGFFGQGFDNALTNPSIPANVINLWASGGTGAQATTSGSGGTVTYAATTLTDTGKAWTTNQWVGRYVVVGTTRGYIASNTATVLTLSAAGWTTNNGGLSEQVSTSTPANGTAYAIPQINTTGIQVQRFGSGNALRLQGMAGSGDTTGNPSPNTDLIFMTQAVNTRLIGVLNDTGTTTADSWAMTMTAKTSGSVFNFFHNVSTFTGTGILLNFANGSGTYTGNYVDFKNNNVSKFTVSSTGALTSADNYTVNVASKGMINSAGDLTLQSTTNNVVLNCSTLAGIFMQFNGVTQAQFTNVGGLNIKAGQALDVLTAGVLNLGGTNASTIQLTPTTAGNVDFHYAVNALGGGAAPTFGTIGGTGPATAGQNSWLKVLVNGTASFIPIWR